MSSKRQIFRNQVTAQVSVSEIDSYPSYTMIVPCPVKDLLRVFFTVDASGKGIETSNFVRLESLPNHIQRLVAEHVQEIKIGADLVSLDEVIEELPSQQVTPSEEPIDLTEFIPKD